MGQGGGVSPEAPSVTRARFGIERAIFPNACVFLVLLFAAALRWFHPDFFYLSVQEDQYLEWATFWAFLLATAIALLAAARSYGQIQRLPWFLAGVGLFCFFVAMEEISWGQRVLGYRPPVYFLEHNFQQEFNFHNVTSTGFRIRVLSTTILGYGVILPLVACLPPLGRLFRRIGLVAPPVSLFPAFLATYVLYKSYPWKYSGEIVELMLGFGFLFAVFETLPRGSTKPAPTEVTQSLGPLLQQLALALAVMVLGVGTATLTQRQATVRPEALTTAQTELEALKQDLLQLLNARGKVSKCGFHRRLYTYVKRSVKKNRRDYLYQGTFASLTRQGLPEERAEFFLDPWNSPYWVRQRCSRKRGRERIVVYSFGPNRRRESTSWKDLGDDLTAVVRDSRATP